MTDLNTLTADQLFDMAMSGDKAKMDAARTELKKREADRVALAATVAAQAAKLQCYFTGKGGVYCKNPNWKPALSKAGDDYEPAVNFATVDQILDICTAGTETNKALLMLANLPADERTKLIEAKKTATVEKLTAQRAALVVKITAGKKPASDLIEWDAKNPGFAPAVAA